VLTDRGAAPGRSRSGLGRCGATAVVRGSGPLGQRYRLRTVAMVRESNQPPVRSPSDCRPRPARPSTISTPPWRLEAQHEHDSLLCDGQVRRRIPWRGAHHARTDGSAGERAGERRACRTLKRAELVLPQNRQRAECAEKGTSRSQDGKVVFAGGENVAVKRYAIDSDRPGRSQPPRWRQTRMCCVLADVGSPNHSAGRPSLRPTSRHEEGRRGSAEPLSIIATRMPATRCGRWSRASRIPGHSMPGVKPGERAGLRGNRTAVVARRHR
jgi:hypothetical protein